MIITVNFENKCLKTKTLETLEQTDQSLDTVTRLDKDDINSVNRFKSASEVDKEKCFPVKKRPEPDDPAQTHQTVKEAVIPMLLKLIHNLQQK